MKTMLCLSGLGGHPSVFAEYPALLPEYKLRVIELVNRDKALAEARAIIEAEESVTLFCNCYGAQMGIQLAAEMPDKVDRLIFLEPFFQEFQPWMILLRPVNLAVLGMVRFFAYIGIHRRNFNYRPDYVALGKYPIFIQPLFDMRWQNLPDYFDKCYDILTYRLPHRVDTPALMIFSPQGFSRNPVMRKKLKKIFPHVRIVEMQKGNHKIVTMDAVTVAASIHEEPGIKD